MILSGSLSVQIDFISLLELVALHKSSTLHKNSFLEKMSPPAKKFRSQSEIYLIGREQNEIVGAKLPSNRQVLSVFFYNTRTTNLSTEKIANLICVKIKMFWEKARIPTSADFYVKKKILDLYNDWRGLQKCEKRPNKSSNHAHKEREFCDKLDDLFDIAAKDALNILKGVDREFLLSQRKKGRVGSLCGVDAIGEAKEARRLKRIEEEENRRRKQAIASKMQCNFIQIDENIDSDIY